MNARRPPELATWLLDRLGRFRQNEALAGDLAEEFAAGRSRAWYWRQTLQIVAQATGRNLYLRAVLVGFSLQFAIAILLWWCGLPRHTEPWLSISAFVIPNILVREIRGRLLGPQDPKDVLAEGVQPKVGIAQAVVRAETCVLWLSAYCSMTMHSRFRYDLADFALMEAVWMVVVLVLALPQMFRATSAPETPPLP